MDWLARKKVIIRKPSCLDTKTTTPTTKVPYHNKTVFLQKPFKSDEK